MAEAVFLPDGPRFFATELARGPWDPSAQHGGAPAALLVRAFERLAAADGLLLARVTCEFLRPVPLGAVEVHVEAVRSGRRMALFEGWIVDGDGTHLVRARALRLRAPQSDLAADRSASDARTSFSPEAIPPPGPPRPDAAATTPEPFSWARRPMFATDAMEIHFTRGQFAEQGPAAAWFRLRVSLVEDETPSPLQRLAATADFGNGISAIVSWQDHVFINPDLTLYVEREPRGEWIHLDAQTRIAPDGIGMAHGDLRDERGPVGRATQALLIEQTR